MINLNQTVKDYSVYHQNKRPYLSLLHVYTIILFNIIKNLGFIYQLGHQNKTIISLKKQFLLIKEYYILL
jgi:hypothetical protein